MKWLVCLALLLMLAPLLAEAPSSVEKWGVYEVTLRGPAAGNPFTEVTLSAVFTNGTHRFEPKGFYDGDGIYKIRFMPNQEGEWQFVTQSSAAELNHVSGSFLCTPPSPGNLGPVQVFNTYHFRYAERTPYIQIGTTCYAWAHQGKELEEQTLKTLATSPFNKMRMCIFPKDYTYNRNEPEFYPFVRDANGVSDFTRFDPAFWRHFEARVLQLQQLGIEADIILFHPYDRWGYATMSDETDDFYLHYAIARLAAVRNVWWSLANEFDFMREKSMEDWDRIFRVITENDPYDHLRGIHNGAIFYDHTKPWVTHASIQSSDFSKMREWQLLYKKPILFDECRYEGNIPEGWGNISAEELVRRFWLATVAGCYCGHGETYKHPEDILWWSKGGILHGESPERIAFLQQVLQDVPEEGIAWLGDGVGGKEGEYYLYYFDGESPTSRAFELPPYARYQVEIIDTWNMTINKLPGTFAGSFAVDLPGKPFMAARIKRVGFDFPAEPVVIGCAGSLFLEQTVVPLTHVTHDAIFYTLDGSAPTIASKRYVEPIIITGDNTVLRAFSVGADGKKSVAVSRTFFKAKPKTGVKVAGLKPGLMCSYYEGQWTQLPDFSKLTPKAQYVVETIDCKKYAGTDHFGMVFDGYIDVPKDDVYIFYARSDDGSRILIDGERVLDNDGLHAPMTVAGEIALAKGLHTIQIQFFENDGGEDLAVFWQSNSFEKSALAAGSLFHK